MPFDNYGGASAYTAVHSPFSFGASPDQIELYQSSRNFVTVDSTYRCQSLRLRLHGMHATEGAGVVGP